MAWSDAARAAAAEVRRRHKTVSVNMIRQQSTLISKKRIAKYAAAMKKGGKFPRVLVTKMPNGRYILEDGHHRLRAALKLGADKIRVHIMHGGTI
jgi:ParB-like chromosome segregation protein Spo0J